MINIKHDITIAVSKGRILEEGLILLKKLEIEIRRPESATNDASCTAIQWNLSHDGSCLYLKLQTGVPTWQLRQGGFFKEVF